jgi:hypothetical protein
MHLWPAPVQQIAARNELIGALTEVEIAAAVVVPAAVAAEAVAAAAPEGEAGVASVGATAAEGTRVIARPRALQNKAATKIAALPFARST